MFTVVATSGTALSYQWYQDGWLFFDKKLTGQTSSTLTLTDVTNGDEGQYFVGVKNAGGTVFSRKATLTVNTAPVANNDTYTTLEDTALIVPTAGILGNDTDADGDALTAVLVNNVTQGSLSLGTDGGFTYTPNPNYHGSDSFTYRASDSLIPGVAILQQNNAGGGKTLILNNDKGAQSFRHGTAGDPDYMLDRVVLYLSRKSGGSGKLNFSIGTARNGGSIAGSALAISASSIANTSEGTSFQTYAIVYDAPLGPFTAGTTYYLNLDNKTGERVYLEYANANTYAGGTYYDDGSNQNKDTRFQILGTALSALATVTINITPVNEPPIAGDDSVTTPEDVSVTIPVLDNDSDAEGTPLTITSTFTTNGTAIISGTDVVFTPSTNFNGVVVFNYTVSDGTNSATANVIVTVTPDNDPPLAVDDFGSVVEDGSENIPVLDNDSDPEGTPLTVIATSTTNGTAVINGDGTKVLVKPADNFNGIIFLTYTVSDGTNSATANVIVTVTPDNDPPLAVNDSTNVLEDASVTIMVLANDYNPDGRPLTITSTFPTNGTAVVSGTNVIFRASTNFNGPVVFTYVIFDGSNSSTGSVAVTVTPVNDVPVASNDTYTTLEDVPLIVPAPGILTNDADADGDALTAVLVDNVTRGSLRLNTSGGFTYTPNPNYFGSDSFTYRAHDGTSTGNVATVTINITPVNDPPIAVNDSTNTLEDVSVTIEVLANDLEVDGTPPTLTGASTTNGTAVLSGSNVVFTPSTNFNGVAVFSYTVFDGADSATAYVTVTVTPVNDAPGANNDTYTTMEDVPLIVPADGILANDVDVDGDVLTAMLMSNVSNGSLSLNPNGSFTYTPDPNYNGTDSFTYRASDGVYPILQENTSGGSKIDVQLGQKGAQSFRHGTAGAPSYTISKVVLYLSREATAPNANLDFTIGTARNAGTIAGSSVAINPSSITNTSSGTSFQRYEIVYATPVGPLTAGTTYYLNLECEAGNARDIFTEYAGSNTYANGTYYDDGNNTGRDMKFAIYESSVSATATVTINVTAVNDAPFANNDSANTLEDMSVTIPVLANDADVEGTPLAITSTSTTNGTAIISGTDIVFTPATNFNGLVVFSYTISDGTDSATASVTVTVTPVNDAPVANHDTYTTLEGAPLTIPAAGILANDADADGDALTAVLVDNVTRGSLSLNTSGGFTYTPNANYFGSDSFTYRAHDGLTTGNVATVTINVTPANDPPIAVNDTTNTLEAVSVTVNVLANDSDPEGSPLTLTGASTTNGTVALSGINIVFTPATNFNGIVVFSYTVSDGTGFATAYVTVTVTPIKDTPLSLSSPGITADGFTFQFSSAAGSRYVIEATTDMTDWVPIETNSTLTGQVAFTDTTATNYPRRFYRVIAR